MQPSGAWTGRNIAIVVALLVITNAVTGATIFFLRPSPEGPVLRVIGPWSGAELDRFQPVMDAFTEDTGIDISYLPVRQEDLQALLPLSFDASQTPADFIFMVSSFIKQFGEDGHAIDMTALNAESDVSPDLFQMVETGGKEYGGTYTGKAKLGFWYMKPFFTANQLDADVTTYQEFTTLLADIAAISGIVNPIVSGDGVGWPLSDITEHFIASFGGAQMHRDLTAGTISWTDTEVRDVFVNYLVPWLAADYFSPPVDFPQPSYNDFCDGDYALYFMGSWITADIPATTDCEADDLGVIPLPSTIGGTVFGADYFFIPTYTNMQDEAERFAAFLMSDEGQTVQIEQGGHIATATGVPLSAYPVGLDRDVGAGMEGRVLLNDLDDMVGGTFQTAFWSQLQDLWTSGDPAGDLDSILVNIEAAMP